MFFPVFVRQAVPGSGDVQVTELFAAKGKTGGIGHGQRDLAFNSAAGIVTRNFPAGPVGAPDEALLVNDQAVSAGDDSLPRQMPVSAGRWHHRALTLRDAFSGTAIIFLVLLLATQWVFFNRAELAREQDWRPGLEQFCKFLHCSLPLRVDLSQLKLLNRDVRQHPRVDEALLVNATLSNQADFTQPYPVLEVNFSGLDGSPVAARHFRPIEYVSDSYAVKHGMPPGEPVPVVLEILDPGEAAASYQFGFL